MQQLAHKDRKETKYFNYILKSSYQRGNKVWWSFVLRKEGSKELPFCKCKCLWQTLDTDHSLWKQCFDWRPMKNGANKKEDWVGEVGEKKMAADLIVQVEHVALCLFPP